jgi:plastocyanin
MAEDQTPPERRCPVSFRIATALAVLAVGTLASGPPGQAQDEKKKGKRPGLELRSSPRFAFSPASVLFTAELKGGDDVEELYCPEVEWEWGDGGKSVTEADCDPWTEGAVIQRRFTANHVFQRAGAYRVKVTLRKTGRQMLSQTMTMTVRAGLGDTSPDPG